MNKIFMNVLAAAVSSAFLIGCTADSVTDEMITLNATASTVEIQDLTVNDLVGRWNIHAMTSSDSVDFDTNGIYTYDLLEETACFDPMFFDFDIEGNVQTRQARLYFDSTGEFTCQTTGDYSATYQISGNELKVTFKVDSIQYTETKIVSRYSDNGEEFLQVTLTKAETDAAVYIADDPGNTVASDIQKIEMIYKKV